MLLPDFCMRRGSACENAAVKLVVLARFMSGFGDDNETSRTREIVQKMFRFLWTETDLNVLTCIDYAWNYRGFSPKHRFIGDVFAFTPRGYGTGIARP